MPRKGERQGGSDAGLEVESPAHRALPKTSPSEPNRDNRRMSNLEPQNIQVPSGLRHWEFIIRQSAVPADAWLDPLVVKRTTNCLTFAAGVTAAGYSGGARLPSAAPAAGVSG